MVFRSLLVALAVCMSLDLPDGFSQMTGETMLAENLLSDHTSGTSVQSDPLARIDLDMALPGSVLGQTTSTSAQHALVVSNPSFTAINDDMAEIFAQDQIEIGRFQDHAPPVAEAVAKIESPRDTPTNNHRELKPGPLSPVSPKGDALAADSGQVLHGEPNLPRQFSTAIQLTRGAVNAWGSLVSSAIDEAETLTR